MQAFARKSYSAWVGVPERTETLVNIISQTTALTFFVKLSGAAFVVTATTAGSVFEGPELDFVVSFFVAALWTLDEVLNG